MKSVKPKGGPSGGHGEPPADGGGRNADADFHGERRSNETHASTTDPTLGSIAKGGARRPAVLSGTK